MLCLAIFTCNSFDAIADSSTIRESKISKNSKIHLFRKSEPVQQQQDEKQTDALWTELKTFLDKHFSEEDALKVLLNFKEVCFQYSMIEFTG